MRQESEDFGWLFECTTHRQTDNKEFKLVQKRKERKKI
jgi:hypothetical protein